MSLLLMREKIKTKFSNYYGKSSECSSGRADLMYWGNLYDKAPNDQSEINLNLNNGIVGFFEKKKWTLIEFLEMTKPTLADNPCMINISVAKPIGTLVRLYNKKDTKLEENSDINVALEKDWMKNFSEFSERNRKAIHNDYFIGFFPLPSSTSYSVNDFLKSPTGLITNNDKIETLLNIYSEMFEAFDRVGFYTAGNIDNRNIILSDGLVTIVAVCPKKFDIRETKVDELSLVTDALIILIEFTRADELHLFAEVYDVLLLKLLQLFNEKNLTNWFKNQSVPFFFKKMLICNIEKLQKFNFNIGQKYEAVKNEIKIIKSSL
jgi:hypothetical protein